MAIPEVCAREVVSSHCLSRMGRVTDRLNTLRARIADKLQPVMMPEDTCKGEDPSAPNPIYPPYFNEMRGYSTDQERTIDLINEMLDRVEL